MWRVDLQLVELVQRLEASLKCRVCHSNHNNNSSGNDKNRVLSNTSSTEFYACKNRWTQFQMSQDMMTGFSIWGAVQAQVLLAPCMWYNTSTLQWSTVVCLHDLRKPDSLTHRERKLPVQDMREVEFRFPDVNGRTILLREHVVISDAVHQPILCYGHLLEHGWGVCGVEQALAHSCGATTLLELQRKSLLLHGYVRVVRNENVEPVFHVRHVNAMLMDDLVSGSVGWSLDSNGVGLGRHCGACWQDPTLACPGMEGDKRRTTLVEVNDSKW